MIRRVCMSCGTPLPGKKKHGFAVGNKIVCGRRKMQKSLADGSLKEIDAPYGCRW